MNYLKTIIIVIVTIFLLSCNLLDITTKDKETLYSVEYDGNGATEGTVPIDNNKYKTGETVIVKGNEGNLKKTGKHFAGWTFSSDGTGTVYTQGNTLTISKSNIILYAKWLDDLNSVGVEIADPEIYDPSSLGLSIKGYKSCYITSDSISVKAQTLLQVDSYAWYLDTQIIKEATDTINLNAKDVGSGNHSLAVVVKKDSVQASASITFTVLAVKNTELYDFEGSTFPSTFQLTTNSSPNGYWKLSTKYSHSGTKSAQAGQLPDSGQSYMFIQGIVPQDSKLYSVSCWFKVSSEEGGDFLTFYVKYDNYWYFLGRCSGEIDWTPYTTILNISSGKTYQIRFGYIKNIAGSAGEDSAWIDDILITYVGN